MQGVWRDIDRIAGVQHLRFLALEADAANAGQTEKRLTNRVGVPRGARARRERNNRTPKTRWRFGGDHRILEHDAGEGLRSAPSGGARPGANNSGFYWHDCVPFSGGSLMTAEMEDELTDRARRSAIKVGKECAYAAGEASTLRVRSPRRDMEELPLLGHH